ncbi:hypothetical protein GS896_27540 [Rhodococcus hoagii]|nr:hypothetical protein [Prescottella equi]MBM4654006.1 hypothetical protein [Prescottella equi]MBM4719731.1 hypothetical protein [Prescottella equi]NKR23528.1 hypothetical protein [Prescottella equi]NKT56318.1 hypothetical protein [Prescottella equi]
MKLYHRTTPDAAAAILASRSWSSKENTQEVYFSTVMDGENVGYGTAVVSVDVPDDVAELEDEFPGGEQHYRVPVSALRGLLASQER